MQRHETRSLLIAAAVGLVGIAVIAPITRSHHSTSIAAATNGSDPSTTLAATGADVPDVTAAGGPSGRPSTTAAVSGAAASADVGNNEDGCFLTVRAIRAGDTGANVTCLQTAMKAKGFYAGPVNGVYDAGTQKAVRDLQTSKDMYVDGIAARETALFLGIWPDETSLVVHTPAPTAGAKDLLGYPLSSVASAGADAPPLPANSGTGRRLVYSRTGQRVWAVDDKGQIIRSWLVSGSKYNNELPGTHTVYSRSTVTTAWNGRAYLHLMVRWLKTTKGNIGFHSIPIHVKDGTPYMTEAELGQRLSGGCQRQAQLDAQFTWDFAQLGTKVVVL